MTPILISDPVLHPCRRHSRLSSNSRTRNLLLHKLNTFEILLLVQVTENPTLTVLTFNSRVASSSQTIIGCGCICNAETVYI